jgi:hypothetical protein
MKRGVFLTGLLILAIGGGLYYFSTSKSYMTIPGVYGSNQMLWLLIAAVGLIITIVGLFKRY